MCRTPVVTAPPSGACQARSGCSCGLRVSGAFALARQRHLACQALCSACWQALAGRPFAPVRCRGGGLWWRRVIQRPPAEASRRRAGGCAARQRWWGWRAALLVVAPCPVRMTEASVRGGRRVPVNGWTRCCARRHRRVTRVERVQARGRRIKLVPLRWGNGLVARSSPAGVCMQSFGCRRPFPSLPARLEFWRRWRGMRGGDFLGDAWDAGGEATACRPPLPRELVGRAFQGGGSEHGPPLLA